jgi:hypothetical protein
LGANNVAKYTDFIAINASLAEVSKFGPNDWELDQKILWYLDIPPIN